jgi:hypothetical protein
MQGGGKYHRLSVRYPVPFWILDFSGMERITDVAIFER